MELTREEEELIYAIRMVRSLIHMAESFPSRVGLDPNEFLVMLGGLQKLARWRFSTLIVDV